MPVPAPYCTVADLHISDSVLLPSTFDKQHEIEQAASDMDALLGFIYQLPLSSLQAHEEKLLASINSKMASGRILLMLYGEGDGEALHSYGLRLLNEAETMLMKLANGEVDLSADRAAPSDLDAHRGPSIKNYDSSSAVESFEKLVLRSENTSWLPGG